MLTKLQKSKLPRLFKMYDADRDGFIEATDFDIIHRRLSDAAGWKEGSAPYQGLKTLLSNRWERMRAHADINRDNRVSLEEWLAYVDGVLQSGEAFESEVRSISDLAFQAFDRDRDGKMDLEEYKGLHRAHGLDHNTAETLFRKLDLNRDGMISSEEYLDLLHQFFRSDDPSDPGNDLFGPV